MTRNKNRIDAIDAESIAQELGIEKGDCLISIDHSPVLDVFDFRMRTAVPSLLIEIEKQNGARIEFDIEKEEYEELGIEFEEPLMDKSKCCKNKCVFCFIDQLPSGLRQSLYFKDDDLRLSFLTGNYVTLTNLDEAELDRLISYRLSPMNISVHTTNPSLRIEMMKNKDAGKLMDQLRKITQAGIWVNCQIVLCPGINDGAALDQTLSDLFDLGEQVKSIALVPVGLTRFRTANKVENLQPFHSSSAAKAIESVARWQKIMLQKRHERVLFASDEFYIKAGIPFPSAEEYDDFPQMENGVGMVPLFIKEMQEGLNKRLKKAKRSMPGLEPDDKNENPKVLFVTGVDAKPYLELFTPMLSDLYGRTFHVKAISNHFFGETVTVAGLVTGGDIIDELAGSSMQKAGYKRVIIPGCMLRAGEQVFLDDLTVQDVEKATGMEITCADPTGEGLLCALDECFPGNIGERKKVKTSEKHRERHREKRCPANGNNNNNKKE